MIWIILAIITAAIIIANAVMGSSNRRINADREMNNVRILADHKARSDAIHNKGNGLN